MITDATTIQRNERAVHRELADGAGVLLHLETGAYYSLNGVGVMVWDLLEGGIAFQELVDGLRNRIQDAPPRLTADIREFLATLEKRDLISVEGGTAA